MNPWRIVFATVAIFLSGTITGAVLVWVGTKTVMPADAYVRKQPVLRPVPTPGELVELGRPEAVQQGLERRRAEFIRTAHWHLNLTREQRQKIDSILREAQERTRALMRDVTPELRREWENAYGQILDTLTPEQREKFQKLVTRRFMQAAPDRPSGPRAPAVGPPPRQREPKE